MINITNPEIALIELNKAILLACDEYELTPKDFVIVARSEVLSALQQLDGFPSIAVCHDDDIPTVTTKKGHASTVYIVPMPWADGTVSTP